MFVKLVGKFVCPSAEWKIQDLGSEISQNFTMAPREHHTQHGPPRGPQSYGVWGS